MVVPPTVTVEDRLDLRIPQGRTRSTTLEQILVIQTQRHREVIEEGQHISQEGTLDPEADHLAAGRKQDPTLEDLLLISLQLKRKN